MSKSYAYFLLLTVVALCTSASTLKRPDGPKQMMEIEERTLNIVNKYRTKKGLNELKSIAYMQELAREHSMKISQGVRSFGHRGWDQRADLLFEKLEIQMVAENVGFNKGHKDPSEHMVGEWVKSKTHKANLLNEEFDITGIGVSISDDGNVYFTQIFASYFED